MSFFRKLLLGVMLSTGMVAGMALDAQPAVAAARLHQFHLGPYKERRTAVSTAVTWKNLGWQWQVYYVQNHPSGPGWILHVWKYS